MIIKQRKHRVYFRIIEFFGRNKMTITSICQTNLYAKYVKIFDMCKFFSKDSVNEKGNVSHPFNLTFLR